MGYGQSVAISATFAVVWTHGSRTYPKVVNEPLVFDFLTPEDAALSVEVLRQPRNGSARFDRRAGALVYTPGRDFAGNDTFTLAVRDKQGNRNEYGQEIFVTGLDGRTAGGASRAAGVK